MAGESAGHKITTPQMVRSDERSNDPAPRRRLMTELATAYLSILAETSGSRVW